MSQFDKIFKSMCKDILENGYYNESDDTRAHWSDGTPAHTIKKSCVVNRYDLSKEPPIMTLRPVPIKSCLDELFFIWQKKSNKISDLNSHIWDAWQLEDGTIGKSYGWQLAQKNIYPKGEFDQVDYILYNLKHHPNSRRLVTNMFNHKDLHTMALYPCAYSMTFNVQGNKLNAILNQRSQDILTANAWNVFQYSCLVYMFAHVSGLEPGELVHVIADAHIYDRHIPQVKELLERPEYDVPELVINHHDNFYDYIVEDFKLINYQKGNQIKIEVAI
jgi:thymidylate synthase